MSTSLRIFAFVLIVIYFVGIFKLLKKRKLGLRYSLLWLFAGCVMIVLDIFPEIMVTLAKLLKIQVASNGLFAMCIFLEIIITISLTVTISNLANRMKVLIQNIALLESRVRLLEKELKEESKNE